MNRTTVTAALDFKAEAARRAGRFEAAGRWLAERVARDCGEFTPMDTGELAEPDLKADGDAWLIIYGQPYARKLYYGVTLEFSRKKHPRATHHWAEKAAAHRLDEWGRGAAKRLGGKWRLG